MEAGTIAFLVLAILVGLYMAWSIGANDVANAMATSVGAGSLTLSQAIIIAAIFEFAGAVLVGAHVTETVRKGIIDPSNFANAPAHLMYGMFAALLASAIWLQIATYFGLPVSTTHSIVGAVFGFGLITAGISSVAWGKMVEIVASWVTSPVIGGLIGFALFTFIRATVLGSERPVRAIRNVAPFLVFLVFGILTLSFIYKGLKNLHLDLSFSSAALIASGVGFGGGFLTFALIGRGGAKYDNELDYVERIFKGLQIITASYVAFAHGANDVANSIGPLAAIISIAKTGTVTGKAQVPVWILVIGGMGIVIGLSTWGYKVIKMVGENIMDMTPARGFAAEFSAATTILLCSKLGLPVSTTHTLVGSVMGVGFARGVTALNLKVIRNIIASWLVTIPATAIGAVVIYGIIRIIISVMA